MSTAVICVSKKWRRQPNTRKMGRTKFRIDWRYGMMLYKWGKCVIGAGNSKQWTKIHHLKIRRNVGYGWLRIGCWGEYLFIRGTRWQGNGENYIMMSIMICNAHTILFGWSNRGDGRGNVARIGERRGCLGFGWGNIRESFILGTQA